MFILVYEINWRQWERCIAKRMKRQREKIKCQGKQTVILTVKKIKRDKSKEIKIESKHPIVQIKKLRKLDKHSREIIEENKERDNVFM